MSLKTSQFDVKDVTIEREDVVYAGFFELRKVSLKHRLFSGVWSPTIERELFAKALAVCAMVYDPARDLIGLVDQFRVGTLASPYGPWTLEGVAGMVEDGEPPEAVIRRELQEEAGLTPFALLPITGFFPTPGSCDEYAHLYCAICDLSQAGGQFGLEEEGEDILFSVHPATEVFDAMLQSRMNNAATLIGLMWLQLNRQQLQEEYGNRVKAGMGQT